MQIDKFQKVDGHDASVGLAFESKRGGTHYRFICCNADGVITKLEQLVDGMWELIDSEPPTGGWGMTRHLDPDSYLVDPARAIALLNAVMSSGGDLKTVGQALVVVTLALRKAGFGGPVAADRRRGH